MSAMHAGAATSRQDRWWLGCKVWPLEMLRANPPSRHAEVQNKLKQHVSCLTALHRRCQSDAMTGDPQVFGSNVREPTSRTSVWSKTIRSGM